MARHPGIVFRALSWNLFHGRAFPPSTWNRPLLDELVEVLAREEWDIALLQEAPPRWFRSLCQRLEANGAIALTSRNFGHALRSRLADWNPNLLASNEGGSNQTLVRPPWRIAETRRLTLARFPERRRLLWTRLERDGAPPLAVGNLHASAHRPRAAARELIHAAEWAAGERLLFGGDLNLRPAVDPGVFAELRERFGLAPPTAPDAIDHLLVRGLDVVEPPARLPPERREVRAADGRTIRLSDHSLVAARFAMK